MRLRNLAPVGLCTVLAEYPGLRFACPGLSNLAPFGAELLDCETEDQSPGTKLCRYQRPPGERGAGWTRGWSVLGQHLDPTPPLYAILCYRLRPLSSLISRRPQLLPPLRRGGA